MQDDMSEWEGIFRKKRADDDQIPGSSPSVSIPVTLTRLPETLFFLYRNNQSVVLNAFRSLPVSAPVTFFTGKNIECAGVCTFITRKLIPAARVFYLSFSLKSICPWIK